LCRAFEKNSTAQGWQEDEVRPQQNVKSLVGKPLSTKEHLGRDSVFAAGSERSAMDLMAVAVSVCVIAHQVVRIREGAEYFSGILWEFHLAIAVGR